MNGLAEAGIPDFFAPGVSAGFVLSALRVSGLVMVAPIWSAQMVPMRVRAALIVIFALILNPAATAGVNLETLRITPASFIAELAIGVVIGLAAAIFVAGAEAAGEQMTVAIGLSGAAIFDPVNNTQGAVLGELMKMIALVVLLIGGGHLVMLRAMSDTFRVMPLGAPINLGLGLHEVVKAGRTVFASGIQFAAPVVAAVLVLNIALAVLGRAAPKLQIMSVAFPLQIGVGLLTLAGSMALIMRTMSDWTPAFGSTIEAFARAANIATTVAPTGAVPGVR